MNARRVLGAAPFLLLAATAGAQPLPATPLQPPLQVPYTQFTLPNGLRVILREDHTVPVATVNVWHHVGSAREKPGRTGCAHLFEHLMFGGSGHVKEAPLDREIGLC